MKKYLIAAVWIIFFASEISCKKSDLRIKESSPSWTVDSVRKYSESMTAVVQLSPNLLATKQANDELGAFINGECRGIGESIRLDTSIAVYFVLIHGNALEKDKILFKYFSDHSSRIYQTDAFLTFTSDGSYGNIDLPAVLDLKPEK